MNTLMLTASLCARRRRSFRLLPLLLLLITGCASSTVPSEAELWQKRAQRVTITRDEWGIAHVRGKTDADAVFGMIYAQAEDDFPRIERNYLIALGRLAEAEGEKEIWETCGPGSTWNRRT
jgi:acyl-homoserine-lactone acylase